jgi:hypothetical protein
MRRTLARQLVVECLGHRVGMGSVMKRMPGINDGSATRRVGACLVHAEANQGLDCGLGYDYAYDRRS